MSRTGGPSATTRDGFELRAGSEPLHRLLRQLWRSASLVAMLARKDFFVRYRRTSFGVLWAVGLPLFQAAVLAVVFSRVVRVETDAAYAPFVYAGFLPWSFLSQSVSVGATAIVDNAALATKIYFPRAVLPLALLGTGLYGLAPGLVIVVAMTAAFGEPLGVDLLWLVPGTVLLVAFAAATTLLLAALHVYFRDVRYVVAAGLMAWFYATPVLYPLDLVPSGLRWIALGNPATGVVELFRAATVGAERDWVTAVMATLAWTALLLVAAAELHRRHDRVFVDLL